MITAALEGEISEVDVDLAWRVSGERGLRLLLIDDDEDEYELLRRALGRIPDGNFWLDWIPSYDAGLAATLRQEHDAYLIDQRLGSGTGLDLIREAKAAGVNAPLIVLTGERDSSLDAAALDAGAADFLVKGQTDPVLLDRTLRYAVAHSRLTDALRRSHEQILGLEQVGQVMADEGPSGAALSQVVDVLGERFGFQYVSVFLSAGDYLELVASRGYQHPVTRFDRASGVIERVTSIDQARFIPNITVDPDHRADAAGVRTELCVPLHVAGECVGLLNVGSPDDRPLGQHDYNAIRTVADRVRVALELRREQEELSARAARFRHLTRLAAEINRGGGDEGFHARVAQAIRGVIPAEATTLCLADGTGRYLLRAASGDADVEVGSPVGGGDGALDRALRENRIVVERGAAAAWEAAVPLVLDGAVIGAISFLRSAADSPFNHLEREAMPLIADQVAMASRSLRPPAVAGPVEGAALFPDPAFSEVLTFLFDSASGAASIAMIEPELDPSLDGAARTQVLATAVAGIARAARRAGRSLVARHGEATVVVAVADDPSSRVAAIRRELLDAAPHRILGLWAGIGSATASTEDSSSPRERAEAALMLAKRAGPDATVTL